MKIFRSKKSTVKMFSNLTSNIKTIVEEAKNDQLRVEKAIKQM